MSRFREIDERLDFLNRALEVDAVTGAQRELGSNVALAPRGRLSLQDELDALEPERADLLDEWAEMSGQDPGGLLNRGEGQQLGEVITGNEDFARADFDELDKIAMASALDGTRKLLFDLNRRSNAEDILRNLIPFGSAFREIMTSWARIGMDNPRIMRRFQQGVQGARDTGFFQTDPQTGEEVFVYPMLGELASISGFGPDSGVQAAFTSPVQSVNLVAGSYLPGAGPVLQIPASAILRNRPGLFWLKDWLLPFGAQSVTADSLLVDNLPAWMRQLTQAWERDTAEASSAKANTMIEVLRAMELSSEFSDLTFNEKLKEAERVSRSLMFIRAGATFFGPASPRVQMTVEDAYGQAFWLSTLADEYRNILEEVDFDQVHATERFTTRFGFDPASISVPKSITIEPRTSTREGLDWELAHTDTFDEFPLTAFYAGPAETVGDYNYSVWARQFDDGTREALSAEEWLSVANDSKARYLYDLQRTRLIESGAKMGSAKIVLALRSYRAFLVGQYPGAFSRVRGVPQKAEFDTKLAELKRWVSNPTLKDTETYTALSKYFAQRDRVIASYMKGGDTRSEEGFSSSDSASGLRAALAQYAEDLIRQHPEFEPLFRFVLAQEVRT